MRLVGLALVAFLVVLGSLVLLLFLVRALVDLGDFPLALDDWGERGFRDHAHVEGKGSSGGEESSSNYTSRDHAACFALLCLSRKRQAVGLTLAEERRARSLYFGSTMSICDMIN